MAGVPGTGLGGIFYVLLVLWMIVRESWLAIRGRTRRSRWKTIARLGGFSTAILTLLWLEGWLLKWVFERFPALLPGAKFRLTAEAAAAADAIAPTLSLAPLAILGLLMLALHLARLLFPRRTGAAL